MDRPAHAVRAAIQLGNLVVADAPVRQAHVQRIGGADLQAGDAHVGAKLTRQAREEIAAADIREIADADFRHAHAHALGNHPQRRALDQAHAAAEDEAIHQRQQWLRVGMDVLVKGVFLLEEGFVLGVAALEAVV